MRVSPIQTDIVWANPSENLNHFEEILQSLSGKTDLAILPEMFTTGFCIDNLHLAESMAGKTVETLRRWAQQYDLALVGSFIAKEEENIYNRAFFVFPDGRVETANKHHLFTYGGENRLFTAGNKKLIVHFKGFNICVLVCYDIRFPVWSRNVNNEYDLLIYTASFPHTRISAWNSLLVARAIENQSYVCGVNRIGVDGKQIAYSGHSVLLDYNGEKISNFEENISAIDKTYTLSLEKLNAFREKYPFWKDADAFQLLK